MHKKKKKYSNYVRTYFSCFTKACNIQNTQYSKTILIYCWFFCTPQRGGKVRNDEFLKKIMNSAKDKLADEEEECLEDEDPFSCV